MRELIITCCLKIAGWCGLKWGDEEGDIHNFLKKMNHIRSTRVQHLSRRKLVERANFIQEELDEFREAIEEQNMMELADALIDIVYVAKGTAIMMGLPWSDMWDEVQRANMAKVPGVGKRGNAADAIKPVGWVAPRHLSILENHGYKREDFCFPGTCQVDPNRCVDDSQHQTR